MLKKLSRKEGSALKDALLQRKMYREVKAVILLKAPLLGKTLQKIREMFREFQFMLANKREGVLVYVGMNHGDGFDAIFRKYQKCYCFEADPDLFDKLNHKYSKYKFVHLFNVAAADYNGEIEFNISNNSGRSSSVGNFSQDWSGGGEGIEMIKTIKVPCVNLYLFLQQKKIDFIDEYVSDIQGFDLTVLKTLKPYIDNKKINYITCEVAKDRNIYNDIGDNSEKAFNIFLSNNYQLVAKGFGILRNGELHNVPDGCWEMDCKWQKKS
jgi:FkbM family methyltransferase